MEGYSSHKKDYSSSSSRREGRVKRYGGKTEGDKGTRRAGRMESRMQLMRKHRAQRRTARKESGIFGKSEAGKMKSQMKGSQRQERRSMYMKQGIMSRRFGQARATAAGGRAAPTLRQRASQRPQQGQPKSQYQRTGGRGRRPIRYGGETGMSGSRREQMRKALED